jgi:cytochrome c oxidase subunit 3
VPYALVVTIFLVSSSVTCRIGVFKAGPATSLRRWCLFTFVLGLIRARPDG